MIYFCVGLIVLLAMGLCCVIMSSTRYKVIRLLEKHNIPYKTWDTNGNTKTLDRLIESVKDREIELESRLDGLLITKTHVAVVTIHHKDGRGWSELREHRLNTNDDEFIPRQFSGSVGGKIKRSKGENPRITAERVLRENLGQSKSEFKEPDLYTLTGERTEVTEILPSTKYAGLHQVDIRYHFLCIANNGLFRHNYERISPGKEPRYFFWLRI